MTTAQHLSALKRVAAQLSSARGELEALQKLGEKAVNELDALNADEAPDANQVALLESRLRGLSAKRTSLNESFSRVESDLGTAVHHAFAALDTAAQSGPEIEAAAQAVLPWCKGIEAARAAALQLPAFAERISHIRWLNLRRDKGDADEIAPALINFLESLVAQAKA